FFFSVFLASLPFAMMHPFIYIYSLYLFVAKYKGDYVPSEIIQNDHFASGQGYSQHIIAKI
ncbi:MAG: hypothetical protein P8Y50_07600, partial [Sulfurovaceae bacterium]